MLKIISKIFIALLIFTIPINVNAEGHWALQARNLGPSKMLRGKINMMIVYVSTPQYRWSDSEIKATFNKIWEAVYAMEKEALRYGVKLNMRGWKYYATSIPMEFSSDNLNWYWYLMHDFLHVENMQAYHNSMSHRENANDTPMIFMLKRPYESSGIVGRTHMVRENSGGWNEEFSYIYCGGGFYGNYIFHELMHQYGAVDLYDYNNEGVQALAKKYFGASCMMNNRYVVDSLTACLIGWTNDVTKNAYNFLYYSANKR